MDEKYHSAIEFLYGLGATFIPTDGKVPVFKGYHERPRDPLPLVLSWTRTYNLALKTGSASGGIVVVDIEKEAEPGVVGELGLPPTAMLRSGGGGMHLYYRTDRKLKTAGPGRLAEKVEFKAEKSLATVVGSVHPNGNVYEWVIPPEQAGIVELPADFIARFEQFIVPEYRPPAPPPPPDRELNENHPYVIEAIKGETSKVVSAGEGARNNTLNEAAFALGTLVGARVLSRATAERELLAAALQCGLPEREAQGTIKSGLNKGEQQPRQIPESVANTQYLAGNGTAGDDGLPPYYNLDSVLREFYGETPRILYHRDTFYVYTGRCYRSLTDGEMAASLAAFITGPEHCRKKWRVREVRRKSRKGASDDGETPAVKTERVNPEVSFLNQGLTLIRGYGVQPSNADIPFWLSTGQPVLNCLGVENGILDLDSYALQPHTPDFFSLVALPYEYDPQATCPQFEAFLSEICQGDSPLVKCVQEIFGYCLQGGQDGQKLFVFCGEGQNGKTVTVNVLKMLIGDRNCSNIGLEALCNPHATAGLVGKLVNFSIEWAHIEPQAEGILKAISGGDGVEVNPKNKPSFSVKLPTKFIITSNQPPHISDRSHGMWRRIMVLPFNFLVPEDKIVPMEVLLGRFRSELPGILNWALAGLQRFRQQTGFTETAAMVQAKDKYRRAGSPVWDWAEATLTVRDDGMLSCDHAYTLYRQWAEQNGHRPASSPHWAEDMARWFRDCFKSELRKVHGTGRSHRAWHFKHLCLSADERVPDSLFDRQYGDN